MRASRPFAYIRIFRSAGVCSSERQRGPRRSLGLPRNASSTVGAVASTTDSMTTAAGDADGRNHESFRIFARLRPAVGSAESSSAMRVVGRFGQQRTVCVRNLEFLLDWVWNVNDTQEDVYAQLSERVSWVLAGFNSTIIAYGQTGSGKVSAVTAASARARPTVRLGGSGLHTTCARRVRAISTLVRSRAALRWGRLTRCLGPTTCSLRALRCAARPICRACTASCRARACSSSPRWPIATTTSRSWCA